MATDPLIDYAQRINDIETQNKADREQMEALESALADALPALVKQLTVPMLVHRSSSGHVEARTCAGDRTAWQSALRPMAYALPVDTWCRLDSVGLHVDVDEPVSFTQTAMGPLFNDERAALEELPLGQDHATILAWHDISDEMWHRSWDRMRLIQRLSKGLTARQTAARQALSRFLSSAVTGISLSEGAVMVWHDKQTSSRVLPVLLPDDARKALQAIFDLNGTGALDFWPQRHAGPPGCISL